jgi:hypothetical protein
MLRLQGGPGLESEYRVSPEDRVKILIVELCRKRRRYSFANYLAEISICCGSELFS